MHQHLSRRIISLHQFRLIIDPAYPAPPPAIKRLHKQRIAHLLRQLRQIKQIMILRRRHPELLRIRPQLRRNQHRLRHPHPQPDHRAIGRMFLHALEGERIIEQIDAVEQGRLLQPFSRLVMPVGQPVDNQMVAGGRRQLEWMNAYALHLDVNNVSAHLDRWP